MKIILETISGEEYERYKYNPFGFEGAFVSPELIKKVIEGQELSLEKQILELKQKLGYNFLYLSMPINQNLELHLNKLMEIIENPGQSYYKERIQICIPATKENYPLIANYFF